jgi:hypothetical protein
VLTRFSAFRNGLYTRMEEISFRTSMTVLGGVVAVAAVIAGVTVLMSQGPAPAARPAALGSSPASHSIVPTSAPPTPAVSPTPATPATSKPARTKAPAVAAPQRAAAYAAPDEDSAPASGYHRPATRWHVSSGAAAWAAWWRSRLAGAGHSGGLAAGLGGGHGFGGFGGFGFGHGLGHR